MPRPEKVQAVAEIKERLQSARAVFLAEYAGLSVKQQQQLRRGLKAGGAEFKVVKMTLARRAAEELNIDALDELLLGPTGLTFAEGDPVAAAKVLQDFAKENDALKIKGGLLLGDFLPPERISELAELEPRDVLLGKIAGAMKAPLFKMAGLLAAMPRNTASLVKALIDKRVEAGEDAPLAPEPVEEPPAEAAETAESEAEAAEAETAESESEAEAAEAETAEPEASTDEAPASEDDEPTDDEPAAEAEEE